MKYIKEFSIFLICLMLGSVVKSFIDLPIPETIYGMIFLFVALVIKVVKVDDVETTSDFLSNVLAFVFLPAGVGLINELDRIKDKGLVIIFIVILSTIITMVVTSKVVEILQRRNKNVWKSLFWNIIILWCFCLR